MTYSILALDPQTGELGVAVATRWPGVGAIVPWVEPGVGAVATQAITNVDLGPAALAAMRGGDSAEAAVRDVLAGEPQRQARQLGAVDAEGGSAAHTGDGCLENAGHLCREGLSIQGNMLESAAVWPQMHEAFSGAAGDLAERLLVAMRAGEDAGGDLRGRQSSALLVAPGTAGVEPWARRFDLRVDDSPLPLDELGRLLRVARAFEGLEVALEAAQAGDFQAGLTGTSAAHELAPDDAQITFWHGVVMLASGQTAAGRSLLDRALREEPGLARFASRSATAVPGSALAPVLRDAGGLAGDER